MNTRIISGMLLYCGRKPIRYEMNEAQAVAVINVVVCGFFFWFDFGYDWS